MLANVKTSNKKMAHIKKLLILLSIMILGVSADLSNKCCKDDAHLVMRTRRCSDGSKPFLDCNKYLYKKKRGVTTFSLDSHENLVIEENPNHSEFTIEHGSYCLDNLNDTDENVALICFDESNEPFWELRGGCAILSIIFMILVLIVYFLVPILRDLQGKCTMHAVANLTMAFAVLATVQLGRFDFPACEILGFNIYFFFLSAFAWLNVTCFHVWRNTVRPTTPSSPKYLYWISIAYGYGIPLTFLTGAIISHTVPGEHLKPGIGTNSCWLSGEKASWIYFYMPITFVLVTNIIMFCWTGTILWKTVGSNFRQSHKLKVLKTKYVIGNFVFPNRYLHIR
ncbi:G-protein coupled receptor Mth-like [Agrilus planipennis]|uniref:G-protein coupled receptor Mth-like n=2 Tax=Agrilus planipennis TaxID=224129 RepID=A0A7F5RD89_AGRPL|nr:G-protein coupled receptor Mth-like [Agrilus planipennis]